MWKVIYIAPSEKLADRIKNKLTEDGFLVKVRPVNLSRQQFEILVPETEIGEVQEVLSDLFHS